LYCFSGKEINVESAGGLTLGEYKDIILNSKDLGARTLLFPGVGEPTLDKNLKPLIDFAHGLGLVSVVYTCGVLDSSTIEFFRNHDVGLILKVDSFDERNYERLVGLPYQRFRESLDRIVEVYNGTVAKYDDAFILTRLAANTVVTRINRNDIRDISVFCDEHRILHFVENLSMVGSAIDNWAMLVGNDEGELAKVVSDFGNRWVSSATVDNKCGPFAYGVTIDINGDMIGCPTARWIRLGNVRESSLVDLIKIYKSEINFGEEHYCLARELANQKECLSRL
jgi:MoaA/NifB/PqqE/SkfB family radical SAM enzyme